MVKGWFEALSLLLLSASPPLLNLAVAGVALLPQARGGQGVVIEAPSLPPLTASMTL